METTYTTIVNDKIVYEGADLEAAIRTWDGQTFQLANPTGGVQAVSIRDGLQVRDGWLLHVTETRVYLHPGIWKEGR